MNLEFLKLDQSKDKRGKKIHVVRLEAAKMEDARQV